MPQPVEGLLRQVVLPDKSGELIGYFSNTLAL